MTVGTKPVKPLGSRLGLTSVLTWQNQKCLGRYLLAFWARSSHDVGRTDAMQLLSLPRVPASGRAHSKPQPLRAPQHRFKGSWRSLEHAQLLRKRSGLWSLIRILLYSIRASPLISGLCIGPLSVVKTFLEWNLA